MRIGFRPIDCKTCPQQIIELEDIVQLENIMSIQINIQAANAKYNVTLSNDAAVDPTPTMARYAMTSWTEVQTKVAAFVNSAADPLAKPATPNA